MIQSPDVVKIALLSSFEGRYREVGYDALYAARLALADSGHDDIFLLAIDDGGSIATAQQRARAIAQDDSVKLTIALGIYATDATVQTEYQQPVIIVGHWGAQVNGDNIYMLSNSALDDRIDTPNQAILDLADKPDAMNGSEILALQQLPLLRNDLSNLTVWSSGRYPDAQFTERYRASDQFAPEPNLLAPLTYDAMTLAIQSIMTDIPLSTIAYDGLHGQIEFDEAGYWSNAPIYEYRYDETNTLQMNDR